MLILWHVWTPGKQVRVKNRMVCAIMYIISSSNRLNLNLGYKCFFLFKALKKTRTRDSHYVYSYVCIVDLPDTWKMAASKKSIFAVNLQGNPLSLQLIRNYSNLNEMHASMSYIFCLPTCTEVLIITA